jgi:hypothetical protein
MPHTICVKVIAIVDGIRMEAECSPAEWVDLCKLAGKAGLHAPTIGGNGQGTVTPVRPPSDKLRHKAQRVLKVLASTGGKTLASKVLAQRAELASVNDLGNATRGIESLAAEFGVRADGLIIKSDSRPTVYGAGPELASFLSRLTENGANKN